VNLDNIPESDLKMSTQRRRKFQMMSEAVEGFRFVISVTGGSRPVQFWKRR
jgi:hypothetical protein